MWPTMCIKMLFSPTYIVSLAKIGFVAALYSQIKEEFPQDGEQDSLQTIRDDTCLEASAK